MIRILVAAVTIATPILLAVPAHADVDQFVSDLDSLGVSHPSPGMWGRGICLDLADGTSQSSEAAGISNASIEGQGTANGIGYGDARQIVSAAVADLCPYV